MKSIFLRITTYICCLLCFVAFAEYYLRSKGYPKGITDQEMAQREGCDIELGWLPAKKTWNYSTPSHEGFVNGCFANITRWIDGSRASYPAARKPTEKRVLILGCSNTMGQGVEDYETYAWRLNEYYHDRTFENHAMDGYGTYQCYLYEKRLASKHPNNYYNLIIYAAIRNHFLRNMAYSLMDLDKYFAPCQDSNDAKQQIDLVFKNENSIMWRCPTVYLRSDHTLGYNPIVEHWPGDTLFASINLLKHLFLFYDSRNFLATMRNGESKESIEIFRLLLDKMNECARQHGSKFAVVYLEDEKDSPILQMRSDKYPILFATNGREGEQDNPKFHVGRVMVYHPNGLVHKNWAKHIRAELEKHNL